VEPLGSPRGLRFENHWWNWKQNSKTLVGMPRGSASGPDRVLRAYCQSWSMAECSVCKAQCCSRKTWLVLRIASFLNTDCILLSTASSFLLVYVSIRTVHTRFMQAVIILYWISGLRQWFLFILSRCIVKPWRRFVLSVTAQAARSVTKIAKERFVFRTGTVQSVRLSLCTACFLMPVRWRW